MKEKLIFLILAVSSCTAVITSCLNGCKCETMVADPTIRCDQLRLDFFPLPIAKPYHGFNFLALTCNSISHIPSVDMILNAFPDLHGIDLQGNKLANCSQLEKFQGRLAVLSDCGASEPFVCEEIRVVVSSVKHNRKHQNKHWEVKEDGREIEDSAEIFIPFSNPIRATRPTCRYNCDNILKMKNKWTNIETFHHAKLSEAWSWLKTSFAQIKRALYDYTRPH